MTFVQNKRMNSSIEKITSDCSNYAERDAFNSKIFHDESTGDKKLTLYTWIYRWESPLEFIIRQKEGVLLPAKKIQARRSRKRNTE